MAKSDFQALLNEAELIRSPIPAMSFEKDQIILKKEKEGENLIGEFKFNFFRKTGCLLKIKKRSKTYKKIQFFPFRHRYLRRPTVTTKNSIYPNTAPNLNSSVAIYSAPAVDADQLPSVTTRTSFYFYFR